jgi:PST family polysaccharide transporter
MVATMGSAPLVAWFYHKPYLAGVTVGLSFGPFLNSLGTQHTALLDRQMRFAALALVQLTTLMAGFAAAFTIALLGGTYWALVASSIASAMWGTAGLWLVSGFRPRWPQKGTDVRPLLRFGASIVGFDVAYYFRDNVGKILIGHVWGAQPLGLYDKAISLMALPLASLRYPLNRVAFPAMSRLGHDGRMFRTYFAKYCSLLAFASMPLVAVLYACSGSIIRLLLGNRWGGTVELFRILAVAGFIETPATLATTVILASGHGRRLVLWGLANASATVLAMTVGLAWGAKGVAVGYCVSTYAMLHPLLVFAFHGTPVRAADFYRAIAKPAVAAICMVAIYLLVIEPVVKGPDSVVVSVALPACALSYLALYAALPGGWVTLREFLGYVSVMSSK